MTDVANKCPECGAVNGTDAELADLYKQIEDLRFELAAEIRAHGAHHTAENARAAEQAKTEIRDKWLDGYPLPPGLTRPEPQQPSTRELIETVKAFLRAGPDSECWSALSELEKRIGGERG